MATGRDETTRHDSTPSDHTHTPHAHPPRSAARWSCGCHCALTERSAAMRCPVTSRHTHSIDRSPSMWSTDFETA
jgi:Tfp pilus assembly protein PilV